MFCDTHCHLTCIDPDKISISDVAKNAVECDVSLVIDISTGLVDFLKRGGLAGELMARYPLEVYLTSGIPPFFADSRTEGDVEAVRAQCIGDERVVAVGEIGLDYYHEYGTKRQQRDLFVEQLSLADELDLPVVVHSRDADEDLVSVLESRAPKRGGVIHCFSSDIATASKLLDLGFVLSFAGNVTYRNSENIREVARMVPSRRYVVETDSPYLAPEGKRGRPNEPANVAIVARYIASLREESVEAVSEATTDTARRVFGIER